MNYTLRSYAEAKSITFDASNAAALLRLAVSDLDVGTLTIDEDIYISGADGTMSNAVTVTINNPNLIINGSAWIRPRPTSLINQWGQPWHVNVVALKELRDVTFARIVPVITSACDAGPMIWDGLTILFNGIRFYPDNLATGKGYKGLGRYQGSIFRNIKFCTNGHQFNELNSAFQGYIDGITIKGCTYYCPSSAATPSPSPYDAILPAGWPTKAPILDDYSNVFLNRTMNIQDWRCFWSGGGNNVTIEDCEFHLFGMYGMIKMYQSIGNLSCLTGISGSYENIIIRRNKFYELGQQECISYDAYSDVVVVRGTVTSVTGATVVFTGTDVTHTVEISKLTGLTYMGMTGASAGHYYKITGPDSLASRTMTVQAYNDDLSAIHTGDTFVIIKAAVNWQIYDNDFYHTEACRVYGVYIGCPVAVQLSGASAGWKVFNNRFNGVRVPFNDYTYVTSTGSIDAPTMGASLENNWMTGYRQLGWQVLAQGHNNQYDSYSAGVYNRNGISRNNIGVNWVYTGISESINGLANGQFGQYPVPYGVTYPVTFGYALADTYNFTDEDNVFDTRPDIPDIPEGYRNIKNAFDMGARNNYRNQAVDPAPLLLQIDANVYYTNSGVCKIYGYCTVNSTITVTTSGSAVVGPVVYNSAKTVWGVYITGAVADQTVTATATRANSKSTTVTATVSVASAPATMSVLTLPTSAPDPVPWQVSVTGLASLAGDITAEIKIGGDTVGHSSVSGQLATRLSGNIAGNSIVCGLLKDMSGAISSISTLSGNIYPPSLKFTSLSVDTTSISYSTDDFLFAADYITGSSLAYGTATTGIRFAANTTASSSGTSVLSSHITFAGQTTGSCYTASALTAGIKLNGILPSVSSTVTAELYNNISRPTVTFFDAPVVQLTGATSAQITYSTQDFYLGAAVIASSAVAADSLTLLAQYSNLEASLSGYTDVASANLLTAISLAGQQVGTSHAAGTFVYLTYSINITGSVQNISITGSVRSEAISGSVVTPYLTGSVLNNLISSSVNREYITGSVYPTLAGKFYIPQPIDCVADLCGSASASAQLSASINLYGLLSGQAWTANAPLSTNSVCSGAVYASSTVASNLLTTISCSGTLSGQSAVNGIMLAGPGQIFANLATSASATGELLTAIKFDGIVTGQGTATSETLDDIINPPTVTFYNQPTAQMMSEFTSMVYYNTQDFYLDAMIAGLAAASADFNYTNIGNMLDVDFMLDVSELG